LLDIIQKQNVASVKYYVWNILPKSDWIPVFTIFFLKECLEQANAYVGRHHKHHQQPGVDSVNSEQGVERQRKSPFVLRAVQFPGEHPERNKNIDEAAAIERGNQDEGSSLCPCLFYAQVPYWEADQRQ